MPLGFGIGEAPVVRQGTVSVWESTRGVEGLRLPVAAPRRGRGRDTAAELVRRGAVHALRVARRDRQHRRGGRRMSEQPRGANFGLAHRHRRPQRHLRSPSLSPRPIYGEAMRRPPELVVQRREIMGSHVHRAGSSVSSRAMRTTRHRFRLRVPRPARRLVARRRHARAGQEAGRRDPRLARRLLRARRAACPPEPARRRHRSASIGVRAVARGGATAVLSTHDRDSPARHLYPSSGFVDLLPDFVFPGSSEVYVVMGKRL